MPPQMQQSSVYMHVMLVFHWQKMETIDNNYGKLAFKYFFYNYDTLPQQHKHIAVLGVWFQSMPLLLNTDWTKLLNLTVLVMGH